MQSGTPCAQRLMRAEHVSSDLNLLVIMFSYIRNRVPLKQQTKRQLTKFSAARICVNYKSIIAFRSHVLTTISAEAPGPQVCRSAGAVSVYCTCYCQLSTLNDELNKPFLTLPTGCLPAAAGGFFKKNHRFSIRI